MSDDHCRICGDSNLTLFAHTAKCRSCGVLLHWPYLESEIANLATRRTQESAREWYTRSSFRNHTNFTNMLRFALGESLAGQSLDILDYGGGGGQFALVCKSHFPQATVHICDISDASLLREWRPMNIQIPFSDFADDQRKFNVIFLNDVLEHVSHPLFVLRQLAGKLKHNGLIVIDTPRQFWIYPLTRLISRSLHAKLLQGSVSESHLQLWSRQSFKLAVNKCGLAICKYKELSEYTMPPEFYLNNMNIRDPIVRFLGSVFYKTARYISKNKIMCVLSRCEPDQPWIVKRGRT